jgi:hypothetical protein
MPLPNAPNKKSGFEPSGALIESAVGCLYAVGGWGKISNFFEDMGITSHDQKMWV